MSESQLVQPKISLLSAELIEQIHAYSLKILATTGVRVDSPQACRLFASRLGSAAVAGDRVRIPPEAVEWALKAAPSTIDIYDRGGERRLRSNSGFSPGRRPHTLRDRRHHPVLPGPPDR
jgi:trimethylamine:corrinoid methyltransferase-like protein